MTVKNWREPPLVSARSWEDNSRIVQFAVSDDVTGRGRTNWRSTPLYQLWTHLLGQLPPINNASVAQGDGVNITFSNLQDATSCFMGVERPYIDRDNGENVLTYVLAVTGSVEHHPRMAAPIRAIAVPDGLCLTVQVCLTHPLQKDDTGVCGSITRIEFVRSESGTNLPIEHSDRYGTRCW